MKLRQTTQPTATVNCRALRPRFVESGQAIQCRRQLALATIGVILLILLG